MPVLLGVIGLFCVGIAVLIVAVATKSDIQLILAAILFVGGWGIVGLANIAARLRSGEGRVSASRAD